MVRPRGITPEPQRKRLQAAARVSDRDAQKRAQTDAVLIQAVRDAHEAGGSIRHIAEVTGRAPNTIQRWLKG